MISNKVLVLVVFLVLICVTGSEVIHLNNCMSNGALEPLEVTLNPKRPTLGDTVHLGLRYKSSEVLTGGEYKIRIYWMRMNVATLTRNLCDFLSCNANTNTEYQVSTTETITSSVMTGRFTIKVEFYNNSRHRLGCYSHEIEIQ